MQPQPRPPTAPPQRGAVRSYLVAALLVPPLAVKLGWSMPGQPLAARLTLAVLPVVGPLSGLVMLSQKLGWVP